MTTVDIVWMNRKSTLGRRAVLGSTLTLSATLAGCVGGRTSDGDAPSPTNESSDPSAENEPENETDDETETEDPGPANYGIDHPIAYRAENDPLIGQPPDETELAIFMVSDPSCPYCREFNDAVFDQMREELIEPGRLSYVYRPYPKVEAWANPAALGLLETYDRDAEAFVALKEYYYNEHEEVADGVTAATRQFLNENTEVDGEAVGDVMINYGRMDDLTESKNAAEEADMTTVPGYAIVKEGEVTTTASGVQSYSNLKTMLGVD